MKFKNLMIAGAVLLVLGCALGLIGFGMGASRSIVWKNGHPQLSKMVVTHQALNSSVENLKINASDVNVSFREGSEFKVESHLLERNTVITSQGKSAVIQTKSTSSEGSTLFRAPTLSFGSAQKETLIITLPDKNQIKSLQLQLSDTTITLEHFSLKNFSGQFRDTKLTARHLSVASPAALNFSDSHLEISDSQFSTLTSKGRDSQLVLTDLQTDIFNVSANDSAFDTSALTVKRAGTWTLNDSRLTLNYPKVAGLMIDGQDSSLHVNHQRQSFPFTDGNLNQSLKISVSDSQINLNH
ncbi:DUF4097 family beta strand repeat-containing protein [Lactococcus allomyrinae]|uniref:Uncharacterized protein n=1 Tax=Lactococcus allomyrinae TaxID=2419773 RepID=A0A387B8S1_9LACT|nr:DUF4097 family beta strand repeat-containing protein [Lactococcus allomyrinae]AYG00215.1 hypothetical protein D7I46_03405 [Lactococcus allomyrinae]